MKSNGFRRLLGVTFGFGLLLVLAMPQLTAAGQKDQTAQKAKSVTVTGCVQAGAQAGDFTLTATDGKTYKLNSSASTPLKDHVGHKVTIKGKMMPAEAQGDSGGEIQVSSLTMVSQSCS